MNIFRKVLSFFSMLWGMIFKKKDKGKDEKKLQHRNILITTNTGDGSFVDIPLCSTLSQAASEERLRIKNDSNNANYELENSISKRPIGSSDQRVIEIHADAERAIVNDELANAEPKSETAECFGNSATAVVSENVEDVSSSCQAGEKVILSKPSCLFNFDEDCLNEEDNIYSVENDPSQEASPPGNRSQSKSESSAPEVILDNLRAEALPLNSEDARISSTVLKIPPITPGEIIIISNRLEIVALDASTEERNSYSESCAENDVHELLTTLIDNVISSQGSTHEISLTTTETEERTLRSDDFDQRMIFGHEWDQISFHTVSVSSSMAVETSGVERLLSSSEHVGDFSNRNNPEEEINHDLTLVQNSPANNTTHEESPINEETTDLKPKIQPVDCTVINIENDSTEEGEPFHHPADVNYSTEDIPNSNLGTSDDYKAQDHVLSGLLGGLIHNLYPDRSKSIRNLQIAEENKLDDQGNVEFEPSAANEIDTDVTKSTTILIPDTSTESSNVDEEFCAEGLDNLELSSPQTSRQKTSDVTSEESQLLNDNLLDENALNDLIIVRPFDISIIDPEPITIRSTNQMRNPKKQFTIITKPAIIEESFPAVNVFKTDDADTLVPFSEDDKCFSAKREETAESCSECDVSMAQSSGSSVVKKCERSVEQVSGSITTKTNTPDETLIRTEAQDSSISFATNDGELGRNEIPLPIDEDSDVNVKNNETDGETPDPECAESADPLHSNDQNYADSADPDISADPEVAKPVEFKYSGSVQNASVGEEIIEMLLNMSHNRSMTKSGDNSTPTDTTLTGDCLLRSVSSSGPTDSAESFNVKNPTIEIQETQNTTGSRSLQGEKSLGQYFSNYLVRSDSLVNFLRIGEPFDNFSMKNLTSAPTISKTPDHLDAITSKGSNAVLKDNPLKENISREKLKVVGCGRNSLGRELDTFPKTVQNSEALSSAENPSPSDNIPDEVLKLCDGFGKLTFSSSASDTDCSLNDLSHSSTNSVHEKIKRLENISNEIQELSERFRNLTVSSLGGEQEVSLNDTSCRRRSWTENDFQCLPESSSTPIIKTMNEGFIEDKNSSLLDDLESYELPRVANTDNLPTPKAEIDADDKIMEPRDSIEGIHTDQIGRAFEGSSKQNDTVLEEKNPVELTSTDKILQLSELAKLPEGEIQERKQPAETLDPQFAFDELPDVLRSEVALDEQGLVGFCLEEAEEPDLEPYSSEDTSLPRLQNESPSAWNEAFMDSLTYRSDSYDACKEDTLPSETFQFFGNLSWPQSSSDTTDKWPLESSEYGGSNLAAYEIMEGESCLQDNGTFSVQEEVSNGSNICANSNDFYPFIDINSYSPSNDNAQENSHLCVGNPTQTCWVRTNFEESGEGPGHTENNFIRPGDGHSSAKSVSSYSTQSVPVPQFNPPNSFHLLNEMDLRTMNGNNRESQGSRSDFSLFDNQRADQRLEMYSSSSDTILPIEIPSPILPGNFLRIDHLTPQDGNPGPNAYNANMFEFFNPFGHTMLSTAGHPAMFNTIFSLPLPIPSHLVLPIPLDLSQNETQLDSIMKDQKRLSFYDPMRNAEHETLQGQIQNCNNLNSDDAPDDFIPVSEREETENAEFELTFVPRSHLSKNASLQTLRSKGDSYNGSLLCDSLKSVLSSLAEDEAFRSSIAGEKMKFSDPSFAYNSCQASLSNDSFPPAVADDGISGGGDDNYSAKVRFLNELNTALNESLIDDEEADQFGSHFRPRGEQFYPSVEKEETISLVETSDDVIVSADFYNSNLNLGDICFVSKEKATPEKTSNSDSRSVVESVMEEMLGGIPSIGVQEFSESSEFCKNEEDEKSPVIEGADSTTNVNEVIQQQMMVLVRHDFQNVDRLNDSNRTIASSDDKSTSQNSSATVLNCRNDVSPGDAENSPVKKPDEEQIDESKSTEIGNAPEAPVFQSKRNKRRRKKSSKVALFAEENAIIEDSEINLPTSASANPIGSQSVCKNNTDKLELSLASVSAELSVVVSPSSDVTDEKILEGGGGKRNRRRRRRN